jgi:uncharacterized membrane protein
LPKDAGTNVSSPNLALRVAGLGAIAGLRSMAAPAAVSRAAHRGDLDGLQDTPLALLASSRTSKLLTVFEAGELIGDKLPMTPSRTSPPPLLGRAASGALVGAALFVSGGRRAVAGGVLGAASAVAGAYASERLRARLGQLTGVPDPAVALLEDAVVFLGARRLLR